MEQFHHNYSSNPCTKTLFFISRIFHRWIHTLCKLLMLLFFPSPSMIPLVSFQFVYFIVYSFFLNHYYPWYEWTSVYLTNLPLKDIWIISSFGLLQIKILCTFMYRFFSEHVFLSLGNHLTMNFWLCPKQHILVL